MLVSGMRAGVVRREPPGSAMVCFSHRRCAGPAMGQVLGTGGDARSSAQARATSVSVVLLSGMSA
jgi:hypothetical protein